jgi:ubiquinone/menaquinone biosynthesis C-methylase UbiE
MSRFSSNQIRQYYDRHTAAFVAFGQGGSIGAIHRAVWGPATKSTHEAFRYVEDQIIKLIRQLPPKFETSHVVDLGCGIGTSLCYLAEHLPIYGTGITLSPVQVRCAKKRIGKTEISSRLIFMEGDYCNLPVSIAQADLAYAIESFVHGATPDQFFSECRKLIRPGGLLVICDDFLRSAPGQTAVQTIESFCEGWHINTLLQRKELRTLAREEGFEHESTVDLSPYLEIRRPRDKIINAVLASLSWLPSISTQLSHLLGGSALQECLEKGWIGYDLVLFRRLDETNIRSQRLT